MPTLNSCSFRKEGSRLASGGFVFVFIYGIYGSCLAEREGHANMDA
jgi:hypothetical protein